MFRQARNALTLVAVAIASAACGGSGSASTGPMIASIQNVSINQDTTAVVPLQVTDSQAGLSSLSVSATSADSTLVLPQGIRVQSNNGVPTLYVTPAEDATGQTMINILVKDQQGHAAQQSFVLTVNAVTVQFSSFAQAVLAKSENDTPSEVNGFTFMQDADTSTAFDALFQ